MSTISSSTTSTTAYKVTADTTGTLVIQTGATPTTAVTVGTDQSFNFSATGQRITGDFSNATVANRVSFQTSTTNGNTTVSAIPNGTASGSGYRSYNASDPTNSAYLWMATSSSDASIISGITGSGTYLPMTFYTGGSERMRVDTSGNVGIGTSSPASILDVKTANDALVNVQSTGTIQSAILNLIGRQASVDNTWSIVSTGNGLSGAQLRFTRGGWTGTPSMLIDSSSNLQFNSGYGSVATAYGCRAWVNWTGGGTTINGSGNVTSITRNGTGSYTVNFTTAMPDANYSSSWAVSNAGAAPVGVVVGLTGPNLNSNNYSSSNITTTSCRVLIGNMSASTPADPTGYCSATFFR